MPETPSTSPVNLMEVSTRTEHARQIVAGFSRSVPALADLWRQVDDALSDIPALTAEVIRLRALLTTCRLDRANLAAAGRATIAACLSGEAEPLAYLRDELHSQGFDPHWGQA